MAIRTGLMSSGFRMSAYNTSYAVIQMSRFGHDTLRQVFNPYPHIRAEKLHAVEYQATEQRVSRWLIRSNVYVPQVGCRDRHRPLGTD